MRTSEARKRPDHDASAPTYSGATPASIAGLTGWWDAGSPPAAGWGSAIASLPDRSGTGRALATSIMGSGPGGGAPTGWLAVPRLCGLLGGLRAEISVSSYAFPATMPLIDKSRRLSVPAVAMGSAQNWTLHLVWSRPGLARTDYTGALVAGMLPLLSIGGAKVLGITNTGADTLTLFPGSGSPRVLSASLTRLHTHSVTLRNTANAGVDVWLDDIPVATAAPNPLAASLAGTLNLFHDGTAATSAQCDFHECALWEAALGASEMAFLVTGPRSVSKRWSSAGLGSRRGARRGYAIVPVGQSNMLGFALDGRPASGLLNLASTLRYQIAALAVYPCGGGYGPAVKGGYTVRGGTGIVGGWFDIAGGGEVATWPVASMGTAFAAYAAGLPATVLEDIAAIYVHWSENDSGMRYSGKANFTAAYQRMIALMRSYLGKTQSQLPVFAMSALPFTLNAPAAGMQMVREAVADTIAAGLNVEMGLPLTADCLPGGAALDSDGAWTGGDNNHMDHVDNQRWGRQVAMPVAAALTTQGLAEKLAIPAGVPRTGGPKIVSWSLDRADAARTTLLVDIVHDAGADLRVPLLAAAGKGWTLMDGGTGPGSPGTLRAAVSCASVGPAQLRLVLESPVSLAGQADRSTCRLHYAYGAAKIGRGSAVTDNYAELAHPAGWDIAADTGPAAALHFPLAATAYGVQGA